MGRRGRAGLAGVLAGIFGFSNFVWAATVPQYDMGMARERTVISSVAGAANQTYRTTPLYLQFPAANQQSISTPTVEFNPATGQDVAYQYTFTSGGSGYLSAVNFPGYTAQQITAWSQGSGGQPANPLNPQQPGYAVQAVQYADPVLTFHPGIQANGTNDAAGQDSLATGPRAEVPGGVDPYASDPQYQAIAVGRFLYYWPEAHYPSSVAAASNIPISGNSGNNTFQVDASPLITPPVSFPAIIAATGQPTTITTSVIVAVSWDGGAVAVPAHVPPGDVVNPWTYTTSHDYPGSVAALTSDPTWVGRAKGCGSECVAFGVASNRHPRVVLWNIATGQETTIGAGQILGQVADTTVAVPGSQTGALNGHTLLYVQDVYGYLYGYDLATGSEAVMYPQPTPSSPPAGNPGNILGQDMLWLPANRQGGPWLTAIVPEPQSGGGTAQALCAFTPDLAQTGQCFTANQLPGQSYTGQTEAGPTGFLDSGGNPSTANPILLISTSGSHGGALWISAPNALFVGMTGTGFLQTVPEPTGSAYIDYAAGVSPQHDILGWTQGDPNGYPALVVLAPTGYAINLGLQTGGGSAVFHPITVSGGTSVTLWGLPHPSGVTCERAPNGQCQSGNNYPGDASPVDAVITDTATGAQTIDPLRHYAYGEWEVPWTAPVNAGSQPVTYTVVLDAANEVGAQAHSTPLSITVNPAPPNGQASGTSGSLALQCGWAKDGDPPITVSHTCTIPAADGGEPPTWFAHHPTIGTKYGDTIIATLTIPTPAPPALPAASITGVHITSADIRHAKRTPNLPGYPGYNSGYEHRFITTTVDTPLTPEGVGAFETTAVGHFVESWAGFPPPVPLGTLQTTTTLTASWTATVFYQYWVSEPHGGGYWASGSYPESGYAAATVQINGSDYFIISTPLGY